METRTNDINARQSTDQFIKYFSASSQIYSEVKTLTEREAILSVPIPLLLSVCAILFPQYKVWAAFYGITLSFLNILFFENMVHSLKKEAAKVQELFDCELFGMEWSSFRIGEKPLPGKVTFAADRYQKSHSKDELKNKLKIWYPDVNNLPIELARIICQRSNLVWDTELRETYVRYLKIIVTMICVIAVGVGIGLKMTMEGFILSLMAVIFPTILWFIREIKKQRGSVETLKQLTSYVNDLWKNALNKNLDQTQIQARTRLLQDEMYSHRASNQPIFEWVYKQIKIKNDMDKQMNTEAQAMIEEALKVLGKDKDKNS
jgi:hypothetical protein